MPTTYLIKNAKKRAPWDQDVPTFPSLPEEQKDLESKRYLHTENVVVTCACDVKKVSNLTYRGNCAQSNIPFPSRDRRAGWDQSLKVQDLSLDGHWQRPW